MRQKQQIQLAENYVLSVGNLFLRHSHANWLKNGLKRRIWSRMRFYPLKLPDGKGLSLS